MTAIGLGGDERWASFMFYLLSSVVPSKTGNRVSVPVLPPTVSSPARCLLYRVSSEVDFFVIFPMTLDEPCHTAWEVEVHFLKQMLQVS